MVKAGPSVVSLPQDDIRRSNRLGSTTFDAAGLDSCQFERFVLHCRSTPFQRSLEAESGSPALLDVVAILPAQLQPRAIRQDDDVVAGRALTHSGDSVAVDDVPPIIRP